jgi:lambda family phage portal protein
MSWVRNTLTKLAAKAGFIASDVADHIASHEFGVGQMFGYAAGRRSRAHADFRGEPLGPNALNETYGEKVLMAARQLHNDNPLISGGVEAVATMVVGRGIDLEPDSPDPAINAKLLKAWKRSCRKVDLAGEMAHDEAQRLIVREWIVAGEVFVRHISTRESGTNVTRIVQEIIRRERLPISGPWGLATDARERNGNRIVQSIELDDRGVPVAFHVRGDGVDDRLFTAMGESVTRVPASQVSHIFRRRSPGQLRGVSMFVAGVRTTLDMQEFLQAILYQARVAASTGAVITGTAPAAKDGKAVVPAGIAASGNGAVDEAGKPVSVMRPGAFTYVPNKDAKVFTLGSNLPGPQAAGTLADLTRLIAVSMGVGYETLSRDFSRVNYSSAKMGQGIERAGFAAMQQRVYQKVEMPRYRAWLSASLLDGSLASVLSPQELAKIVSDFESYVESKAVYPGHVSVDPLKDANATAMELELGITSRRRACAERGRDWKTVVAELLDEEQELVEERKRRGLPINGLVGSAAAKAAAVDPYAGEPENQTGTGAADGSQDDSQATPSSDNTSGQDAGSEANAQAAGTRRGGLLRLVLGPIKERRRA